MRFRNRFDPIARGKQHLQILHRIEWPFFVVTNQKKMKPYQADSFLFSASQKSKSPTRNECNQQHFLR